MKIKLPEHDHKLTNILKVLLFSLLMLLPFLDIGTRCGYVLLNKNAYQSYYGETINESIQHDIESVNNLELNTPYYWQSGVEDINGNGFNIYLTNVNNIVGNPETTYDGTDVNKLYVGNYYISFVHDTTTLFSINTTSFAISFDFELTNIQSNFPSNLLSYIHYDTYNAYSYLDNVFDYSIDKMANSPLYNWTTNTGMYTGVNAMTTGLGITTPLFAILITYWMFLTIIYIILDIVLSLFTFMTHIFTKKE